MSLLITRYVVAVAFARGGDVVAHDVQLGIADANRLEHLLAGLAALGHVAAFSIGPTGATGSGEELIACLRQKCGSVAVDAILAAKRPRPEPPPAFLAAVWPFDHKLGGMPASTARFCGLDLELIAMPSLDEELGIVLPGHEGLWLVHARPLMF